MKNFLLLILIMFVYNCCYNYPDIARTDRDNALIITSHRFENGLSPYDTVTAIGNIITTGTSSILLSSLLSERHLAFLFWIWFVTILYTGNNFLSLGLFFLIAFPLFARSMIYRLEELYFGIVPVYYFIKLNSKEI